VNANCGGAAVERLEERLERVVEEQGQRAVVIGQSRGGSLAKVLAVAPPGPRLRPDRAGLASDRPACRAPARAPSGRGDRPARLARSAGAVQALLPRGRLLRLVLGGAGRAVPAGVGFVSIYSRSDGIVDWRACLDPAPTS